MNEHVAIKVPASDDLYEADFVAWTEAQAELIRQRRFDELDVENLAEEIESLGRSRRRELHRRMARLLEHLIKLAVSRDYDPRRQWILSVNEQRDRIAEIVEENPSLRAHVPVAFNKSWPRAAEMARGGLEEYDHDLVARVPSFGVEDALDPTFIPEQ